MFRKVLVANRGEIAVRIIRALREMGITSVTAYSDADRASLAVRMADEAIHIGPASSSESYLNIPRILEAARACGADAIHPGYGFLSESADFAAACETAGVTFIGPSAESIRQMGSKTAARRKAKAAGTPVIPGTEEPVRDPAEARRIAAELGYPVLLKAAAGGGGKGMRRVDREEELDAALRDAASEADRAFHDASVYIEKLIERPRHIEIQVLGDRFGNLIHLGERECSVQRRHQKVIEECPSPLMIKHPELRQKMGEAALFAARAVGYYNAGTVEFLVDENDNFYFLEMNTRLQVEHPVTELVTGLDLVQWQIRIAAGERLPIRQEDITWRGSAIECRIYAEDPDNGFLPSPGRIARLSMPHGPGVRLDSGIFEGWTVPVEYDPLLAKLAVWAPDRGAAIDRMLRALDECYIAGVKTNISFFREILADVCFRQGALHTDFIEGFFKRRHGATGSRADADREAIAALVAAIRSMETRPPAPASPPVQSNWRIAGRQEMFR